MLGRKLLLWGATRLADHEWLLDALISEVSIWGCEECGQGSRTLPTANSEFLRSLVPLNGVRRSRLFGQLPGRNKLKAGGRLLVSPFPEIKFILSCCGVL